MDFYSFTVKTSTGETIPLSSYRGKTILVVNTATKCSLTPQFAGLERLHEDYKDKGLVILGFPCNQFFGQEPTSNEDMTEFCQINHGVTFTLLEKINVNGKDAHPLYKWLKKQKRGPFFISKIKWNFAKFLISPEGKVVKRFMPFVAPYKMEHFILEQLKH